MHQVPRSFGRSARVAAVIAVAALTLVVPGSVAQTPVADTAEEAHPAHIHSGTCDELGDVVYPLADVVTQSGVVIAVEAASGNDRWRYDTGFAPSQLGAWDLAVAEGLVVVPGAGFLLALG